VQNPRRLGAEGHSTVQRDPWDPYDPDGVSDHRDAITLRSRDLSVDVEILQLARPGKAKRLNPFAPPATAEPEVASHGLGVAEGVERPAHRHPVLVLRSRRLDDLGTQDTDLGLDGAGDR
jgi:hypothetical protein